MAHIVLINPRFEVSYWGLEHALPIVGKRAVVPPACLPLLAALTPAPHRVTLIDENVQPIDYAGVARADVVGLTGMNVQRQRMREILGELKRRGVFTVVGGPWASVHEESFAGLADVVFVGEAEQTWPQFLADWQAGRHRSRYEQKQRTEMTGVPTPHYASLPLRHYLFGSVQFSRGCPHQCEFCDIIVTFGRRPRLKSAAQVLAELDALRREGMETVFIVDDNLIGNRPAIHALLGHVAAWQRRHGYPLAFFTEASLELADDRELLGRMVEANVQTVFVGIESTNEESLRETGKLQNLRGARPIAERVHAIQDAGLEVWCGMIVGFDHDDAGVFACHREFLRRARVMHAMVGMLSAIPKTPLYARLAAEGRLDPDESGFGTNVIPLAMSRAQLRDGFVQLMQELYKPEEYFGRFEDLYLAGLFRFGLAQRQYWRRHPWTSFRARTVVVLRCLGLFVLLMRRVPQAELRREYRRRLWRTLKARPDPSVLFILLLKCVVHYHHATMAAHMAQGTTPVRNPF